MQDLDRKAREGNSLCDEACRTLGESKAPPHGTKRERASSIDTPHVQDESEKLDDHQDKRARTEEPPAANITLNDIYRSQQEAQQRQAEIDANLLNEVRRSNELQAEMNDIVRNAGNSAHSSAWMGSPPDGH